MSLLLCLFWETLWSFLNWSLKFPSWPSSTLFTHLSTRCFFPLWWVQVKKKSLPSSPTPLLLAQNRMIKARVSHLSNCNYATVPSKGRCHIVRWQGIDMKVLSPSRVRSEEAGRCVLLCCSEWSDQRGGGEVSWRTDFLRCVYSFLVEFSIRHLAARICFVCSWLGW